MLAAPGSGPPFSLREFLSMDTLEARLGAIDSVLADLPQVHLHEPSGVSFTDRDCYELLAAHCPPGARTLETGLGMSTLLFAMWGTEHICVAPNEDEVRRWQEHCRSRGIRAAGVRFEIARSDEALPRLEVNHLDAVLVDGLHGFPTPIIDWYYAGSWLRRDGIIILDDVQLPHVRLGLLSFLNKDPRWDRLAETNKWVAYRKLRDEGSLSETWQDQHFLWSARERARRIAREGPIRVARRKLSRTLQRMSAGRPTSA
jgi:hypothetical protein